MGDLPLRFDRLGTRLCGIGPFDVRYAEGGGRPVALGAWPVRYDGDRLASIGPFGARFEDGVLREIGPLLLRYDGEHHPVRVVCTDGRPGIDPGLTAVLFLVIHRREYRTDLWE
ncbi:hypothetical protein BEL07_14450 [Mycolicibacterium grossiae]|uniref:Uncharacterized protein n=1 Tax=Mycolicibacterium grossiae TaxID=1552759 RepID=A0A1E8Q3R7_9MYCO|nr:hypothetical protein BEL07_14450 [Mycolicibacterium grossiae]